MPWGLPPPPPPPTYVQYGGGGHGITGGGAYTPAGGGSYNGNGVPQGDGTPGVLSGPPAPSVVNSVAQTRPFSTLNPVPVGTGLPVVLGRERVEAKLLHQVAGPPEILIYAVAAGPIHGMPHVYFNGEEVTSGSDGVTWTAHLGAYAQSVDGTVQTFVGNYRLPGTAYIVFSIFGGDSFNDPSPWYGVVSQVVVDVEGIDLYDPRENRITHSEDFSNTYWSCTPAFPTVATGQTDRFNGTAATRWTFGGSGPYIISRATSGLSLTTADPVTVAIDIRTTSGTIPNVVLSASKTVGGASATTTFTVTTSWRRRIVTLAAGAGTGEAQIQLSGIPSSAVIDVAFVSDQIKDQDYGYTKTVASAVTAGSRYSENPVLAMLYMETDEVNGAGGTPTSKVNMAKWGRAAEQCDGLQADGTATWSIGYAITEAGNWRAVREAIRGACAAEVYWEDGLLCCWVDGYQTGDPVLTFDTRTNAISPRFWLTPALDRPTQVVIQYNDADKEYAHSEAQADHPQLKAGTVKLQRVVYTYDAIVLERVAARCARYVEGRARLCEGNVSFGTDFVGIRLERGQLITLTTEDGLSAQEFLVDTFQTDDTGRWSVTAHEYDAALYAFDSITPDTPISSTLYGLNAAPPPIRAIGMSNFAVANDAAIFWHSPQAYKAPVQYGSSYWSSGTLTGFDAAKVNDGNTSVVAGTFPSSAGGSVLFDAGSGNTKRFGKCRIYISGYTDGLVPIIAYGDASPPSTTSDSSAWLSPDIFANARCSQEFQDYESGSGYIDLDWRDIGGHRYWRIFKTDVGGAFDIKEVQFYELEDAYPPQWIAGYEVRKGSSINSPLVAFWPGAKPPQMSMFVMGEGDYPGNLLNVDPWIDRVPGSGLTTLSMALTIVTRSITGRRSTGRTISRNLTTTPGTAGTVAMPFVAVQSTIGDVQPGGAALEQLKADPQDAGTVALQVNNVASPTVSLAEFALDDVVQLDIDEHGSLRTDESARVAPWLEARVDCSTQTTINSTTASDITDATITFTPPSDVRALIAVSWDVDVSTVGDSLIGELVVDGTPEAQQALFKLPTANTRLSGAQTYAVVLAGGASHTIKLQAKLKTSGATYHVNEGTGFVILGVGRF